LRVTHVFRYILGMGQAEPAAMPDHFHLLLTVESDTTIERAVQFIKGSSLHMGRVGAASRGGHKTAAEAGLL
jgi:REP element-mobilizing transposase RayT